LKSFEEVLDLGFDLRVLHGLSRPVHVHHQWLAVVSWSAIGEVCRASDVNARMEHSRRSKMRFVAGLQGSQSEAARWDVAGIDVHGNMLWL
jgi:hypothetical protein